MTDMDTIYATPTLVDQGDVVVATLGGGSTTWEGHPVKNACNTTNDNGGSNAYNTDTQSRAETIGDTMGGSD